MGHRRFTVDAAPAELATPDELRALQLERLRATLERAYERVPHYRASFDAAGVHPDELRSLGELARFPFTTKDDLRANYPFGMFAVPLRKVVRIHASSGTTGRAQKKHLKSQRAVSSILTLFGTGGVSLR